ncbi:hypothetical protein FHW75_003748 [Pseudomonas sp. OG7]|jgi:hypothetical protein|nr:hypothetical protein [Pseudomonas sp. OG7]
MQAPPGAGVAAVAAGIYLVRPTARLNTAALGAFKAWLEDRF